MTRTAVNESNSDSLWDLSFTFKFADFARSNLRDIFCAKKPKTYCMLFDKQSIMKIKKAIPVISTPTKNV